MSTLENASAVLKLFTADGTGLYPLGLSFSDVASHLQLPKSTVSRLLIAMESQGLLSRNPNNRLYTIGDLLLAVGSNYLSRPLAEIAASGLFPLASQYQCTAYLSRLENDRVYVIDFFHGHPSMPLPFSRGESLPAMQTAAGRALLSAFTESEVMARLISRDACRGVFDKPGAARLWQRLSLVRRQGWSFSRNEAREGVSALATMLSHSARRENIALSLTYNSAGENDTFPEEMLASLKSVTRQLADKIGDDSWRRR
ncbi:IclR family transcriptional regulator [Biostraticola tofi]|uniref:IclR family transcriptional regulator n=1 Tax=Biostraticola tofi TaxID=466109 RepID=A0A4R3YPT5_9GAMM|nr:IclR family transcriptional regulator C-terminal domain-containing protein [Biostraticola tofi]TCV94346.1 IclR family transcriptional regulator [Biostraticola tofi]